MCNATNRELHTSAAKPVKVGLRVASDRDLGIPGECARDLALCMGKAAEVRWMIQLRVFAPKLTGKPNDVRGPTGVRLLGAGGRNRGRRDERPRVPCGIARRRSRATAASAEDHEGSG